MIPCEKGEGDEEEEGQGKGEEKNEDADEEKGSDEGEAKKHLLESPFLLDLGAFLLRRFRFPIDQGAAQLLVLTARPPLPFSLLPQRILAAKAAALKGSAASEVWGEFTVVGFVGRSRRRGGGRRRRGGRRGSG